MPLISSACFLYSTTNVDDYFVHSMYIKNVGEYGYVLRTSYAIEEFNSTKFLITSLIVSCIHN